MWVERYTLNYGELTSLINSAMKLNIVCRAWHKVLKICFSLWFTCWISYFSFGCIVGYILPYGKEDFFVWHEKPHQGLWRYLLRVPPWLLPVTKTAPIIHTTGVFLALFLSFSCWEWTFLHLAESSNPSNEGQMPSLAIPSAQFGHLPSAGWSLASELHGPGSHTGSATY